MTNQQLLNKYLVIIAGPTAIGKTAMAIQVAKHFQTEIISADSRQFFKEISIGTAKPHEQELKEVKHHFINSHHLTDPIDAGIFEREAIALLEKLFAKHRVVVMVGGSGLYIDAVRNGLDALPEKDEQIREELHTRTLRELQDELKMLDPEYFEQVDQQNTQRLMRAIEVCRLTGKKYSEVRKGAKKERPFHIISIGLNTDREKLYDRINKRVDAMIEQGLVEEAERTKQYRNTYALQTVGYTEIFEYLDGKTTLAEAVELIKRNTRRFAKRQLTWFNRNEEMKWFEPDDTEGIIRYIVLSTE